MGRITCTFATGLIGLFLLLMGLGFFWFGTRSLIRMWAWEKLTLKNGSEAMTRWIRPPQPVILKVYFFNVTNPNAVSEGALPVFSEIGPYVYEEVRDKVNLVQLDNFTLSYQLRNIIKFKPSLSGGRRESDLVTTINIPLAGAVLSMNEAVPEFVGMMNDLWKLFYPGQENIFLTTRVRDILFDGITIDCTSKITEIYIACRALETRKPDTVRKEGKNFKFSFFYTKNGTSKETYQVDQGIYDLKKSAQLLGINNSSFVNTWRNRFCDMINGSDGAQFPVMINKDQRLYIFEKDLCRSVYTEFEKVVFKKGVLLYKYSNTRSLFASPEENPDNKCFCRSPLNLKDLIQDESEKLQEEIKGEESICFENGILPLMPCIGAPVVASFPHFYMGDQSYINYSGLNPVKDLHETYIYVEPNSGMAVEGFKRIQFNMEVKRIMDLEITSNLVDGLFPLLWIEEEMALSNDLFKLLRYSLVEKKILEHGTFVLIGVGFFLIIASYFTRFLIDRSICCENKRLSGGEDLRRMIGVEAQKKLWVGAKVAASPGDSLNPRTDKYFQKHSLIGNFIQ